MCVSVLVFFPHFCCNWIDFSFSKKNCRVFVWMHESIGQTHDYYGKTIYYVVMMMTVSASVSVWSAQIYTDNKWTNSIIRRLFVFSIFLFHSQFGCVYACARVSVLMCVCVLCLLVHTPLQHAAYSTPNESRKNTNNRIKRRSNEHTFTLTIKIQRHVPSHLCMYCTYYTYQLNVYVYRVHWNYIHMCAIILVATQEARHIVYVYIRTYHKQTHFGETKTKTKTRRGRERESERERLNQFKLKYNTVFTVLQS